MRHQAPGTRQQKGFTLIELLVSLFIVSLMVISLVFLYTKYGQQFTLQSTQIEVAQSAAASLNEINRMVLQGDAIAASHSISGTTYTTGSTTLVVELPAINSSGDVIASTYDYAVFYTSGTNLYRIIDPNASSNRKSSTKTLSADLANITFTYDNGSVSLATYVNAFIRTSATVRGQTLETRLSGQYYLRNK